VRRPSGTGSSYPTRQPHLIDGLHRVAAALGGLSRDWRFDRMATVVTPGTGKVSASFSAVAKHYGVTIRPCPPRRGNRKGVVEKANHVAAQRFWRTLPDDVTVEEAQARLGKWCTTQGDGWMRATADGRCTVANFTCGPGARWCARADALFNLPGMHVLDVKGRDDARLVVTVESDADVGCCPSCGVVAVGHGRRVHEVADAPCFGVPTLVRWRKRIFRCADPACEVGTFSERHALAGPAGEADPACHQLGDGRPEPRRHHRLGASAPPRGGLAYLLERRRGRGEPAGRRPGPPQRRADAGGG